jgi:hypothetical protein
MLPFPCPALLLRAKGKTITNEIHLQVEAFQAGTADMALLFFGELTIVCPPKHFFFDTSNLLPFQH